MASILKGAPVVAAMNERNAALCEQLKTKGIVPTLAVVRVGAREDDLSYERGVMTRCGKVGVEVKQYLLPADAAQDDLLKVIAEINADDAIHGCLLFRPLPSFMDEGRVCELLVPDKDVDGITLASLGSVFTDGHTGFPPCTAAACIEMLDHYDVPLVGKHVVVVGRSLVVGKPVSMMLLRRNATVTLCHSRTENLADVVLIDVAEGLPGRFVRTHRSCVVNATHVVETVRYRVMLDNGMRCPVAEKRYHEVRRAIESAIAL